MYYLLMITLLFLSTQCASRGDFAIEDIAQYESLVEKGQYKKVFYEDGSVVYFPTALSKYYEPNTKKQFDLSSFQPRSNLSGMIYEPSGELKNRIITDYQKSKTGKVFVDIDGQKVNSFLSKDAILIQEYAH